MSLALWPNLQVQKWPCIFGDNIPNYHKDTQQVEEEGVRFDDDYIQPSEYFNEEMIISLQGQDANDAVLGFFLVV